MGLVMKMGDVLKSIDANSRWKALLPELRANRGSCPFVVDAQAAKHVALSHLSGGRDAMYVVVARKPNGQSPLPALAVMIGYAPFVEGTTIIYDVTDETMQGKARPFVCDLGRRMERMYAVLPFQVEETSIRCQGTSEDRRLEVAFLDGRRQRIQAALPFELRLLNPDGATLMAEYVATDRHGRFSRPMPSRSIATATTATVRSLLTGRERSITL
jgi:hypothetical protein